MNCLTLQYEKKNWTKYKVCYILNLFFSEIIKSDSSFTSRLQCPKKKIKLTGIDYIYRKVKYIYENWNIVNVFSPKDYIGYIFNKKIQLMCTHLLHYLA